MKKVRFKYLRRSASNVHSTVTSGLKDEKGNIFFTLFGAVALVGLLGTVTVSVMRGPLSTMVEVQSRSKAESEMAIASRLTLLEATELANNGDCDGDNFVEPLEYTDAGGSGPTGGGFLPNAVASSRIDPWGTDYGYCAWDAGPTTNTIACDTDSSGTNERLNGNGDGTDETYTVIAIISAGPDQTFDTSCVGGASPAVNKGGDDMVVEYTYATATGATDGLWNIKSGDPDTAEIAKNIAVTGGASFTAGIDLSSSSAALKLGAASMLFPTETQLSTCNGANDGLIRLNTTTDPDFLELCDDPNGWIAIGSGSSLWQSGTGDDIYYDATTPQIGIGITSPSEALDVSGNIAATGNLLTGGNVSATDIAGSGNATIGGTLGVTGTSNLGILNATGAVDFDSTLNVDGASTLGGTLDVTGTTTVADLNATGAVDFDSTVNVDGSTTLGGTLDAQGTVSSSTGDLTLGDDVDITGTLDTQGSISNSTGNVNISDSVDISSDLNVTGNGDIDGTLEADEYTWNGNDFTPSTCSSGSFNRWDGNSWVCDPDTVGSGGSGSSLNGLSDVTISGAIDGECLAYDNGTGEWVNASCAGLGLWSDNTTHISRGNVHILNPGETMTTAGFDGGSSGMIYHADKLALRIGGASTTHWDEANIGEKSLAVGSGLASGRGTLSVGPSNATGLYSVAFARGDASGDGSFAMGYAVDATAGGSFAIGAYSLASGGNSISMGVRTTSDGGNSVALGRGVNVTGNQSFGYGLGVPTAGSEPIVSGTSSFGIFSGDQSGYDLTADNRMALVGADFLIDDNGLTGSQGCIRYNGGTSELEYSDDCTTYTSFTNGISGLWTDLGGGRIHYGSDSSTQVGIGTSNPQATLDVNGGVRVGSVSGGATPSFMNLNDLGDVSTSSPTGGECLAYDGGTGFWVNASCADMGLWTDNTTHITRESFHILDTGETFTSAGFDDVNGHFAAWHPDKGAFRAGDFDSRWNESKIGTHSTAFGMRTEASGNYSFAAGNGARATGPSSAAFGTDSRASGLHAFAAGYGAIAGGNWGSAHGRTVRTSGDYAVGFGMGYASPAPLVSGESSLGIFMGDQTGYNLSTPNRMALVGGDFLIDDDGTAGSQGCIRYTEGTGLEYSDDCTTFATFSSLGGGLWTDNTTHITRGNVHILNSGQTTDSAGFSDAGGGSGFSGMIYDTDNYALRGGTLDNGSNAWDDANIGENSFAWGWRALASGGDSIALGDSASASASNTVAIGSAASASGSGSAVAIGFGASSSGGSSIAMGRSSSATGTDSVAVGASVRASGDYSTAYGRQAEASGISSVAIGAGDASGTRPVVSGNSSLGIFMGDQSGYDLSTANRMALVGGDFLIDDDGTAGSQGCIRYTEGTGLEYSDDCTTFTALKNAGGDANIFEVTGTAGSETVRQNNTNAPYATADFIFGSPQINDDGNSDHETRMYFDKSKGAFRAGHTGYDFWDEANTGDYSTAFGFDAIASGNRSFAAGGGRPQARGHGSVALGHWSEATDTYSYAFGSFVTSSANHSMAFGSGTTASANHAISMGKGVIASGANSFALGLGNPSGTNPAVSGVSSLGIFMGDQSGVDISNSNVMAIMGGDVGIGKQTPNMYGTDRALTVSSNNGVSGRTAAVEIEGLQTGSNGNYAALLMFNGSSNGVGLTGRRFGADNSAAMLFSTSNAGTFTEKMRLSPQGYLGIANTSPNVELDVTGDIEYTGTLTDVSDLRLKDNIKPLIENGNLLERIEQIDTYSFTMKDDERGRTEFGVMAQELEAIFPELVHTADDEMGTKSVNYVGLIAPMIEATKALKAEKDTLQSELSHVKEAQASTTERLDTLTEQVALLNKTAVTRSNKASMEGYMMLLLGLLGGFGLALLIQRKAHNG